MHSSPRTSAMIAVLVLAVLAGFRLATVSAEEQTGVILTHLPDKTSTEYKALRDIGAPIGGRDLTMTGAEMWTVPGHALRGTAQGRDEAGRCRSTPR